MSRVSYPFRYVFFFAVLFICFDTVPSQFSAHINFNRHLVCVCVCVCRFTSVFIWIVCKWWWTPHKLWQDSIQSPRTTNAYVIFSSSRERSVSVPSSSLHEKKTPNEQFTVKPRQTTTTQYSRCIGRSFFGPISLHCCNPLDFKIFRPLKSNRMRMRRKKTKKKTIRSGASLTRVYIEISVRIMCVNEKP